MATSFATAADSWAVVPVSADPAYWQVLARSANSTTWRLVTPAGVASNSGLVAAPGATSAITVAVRPSQNLTFSPLAATADGGSTWSTGGPVNAAVAASPDALASFGDRLLALLGDGAVETSSDAGAAWSTLAAPGAIAASAAGKGCAGAVRVTSVSFGMTGTDVLAGGTCGTGGTAAMFSYSPGTGWQRISLPVTGQLVRLTDGMALVRGGDGLTALWRGAGWYAYAPPSSTPQATPTNWDTSPALRASGTVTASGTLSGDGAWVLLSDGTAATVSAPQASAGWRQLPKVPAHTSVLASGPDGAIDALAVSGDTLAVWRLAPGATTWSPAEAINVPVQTGSSS